jgi:hypothetical protein
VNQQLPILVILEGGPVNIVQELVWGIMKLKDNRVGFLPWTMACTFAL